MKPILFNSEMARAIQNGTKTATRRVVKPQPPESTSDVYFNRIIDGVARWGWRGSGALCDRTPPYRPGDILYVRESFWQRPDGEYIYKSDYNNAKYLTWHPSIHMPREAARIFLRVTDVRVERLQDITVDGILSEGIDVEMPPICRQSMSPDFPSDRQRAQWEKMPDTQREEYINNRARHTYIGWCDYADRLFNAFARLWNALYAKPRPVKVKGVIDHYESYPWEDIQETRTYRGKPWYVMGNPWVFANEFEQCEKPEEDV